MPLPLKAGYNFSYHHSCRPPRYEMTAAEAYTDFYGLSYLISGENLSYSPEGMYVLQEGDISFIPQNIYYRSSYISEGPRESVLIKFTDSMVSDLVKIMGVSCFNDLLVGRQTVIHLNKSLRKDVLDILKEMEQEWNSYNEYSEIILKGLLNKLIILCLSRRDDAEENPITKEEIKEDKLAMAIKYVKGNLEKSPSLQETAEHIQISPSYLSKIFINRLHTPYSAFVLNEKILYAQKLLVNSDEGMTEIAKKAGFSSNTYFSDCFKRVTGSSPLQFRKEMSSI
ncbi:MAG: AraC family transcriptional regulator [Lachnospiraceae bacterium]|nr:AraC family transcriptional regulator [Lachnospiraceae bacterium]